jgi:hypothetical protein
VFFPFDDHSIPFTDGLRLNMIAGKKPGQRNPIVLQTGDPGAPDSSVVRYYGTVIRIGEMLHMWYLARGDQDQDGSLGGQLRLCYATSEDGIHWQKPSLGIYEYNGTKDNNLVHFLPDHGIAAAPILYEPDEPDPSRRYKLAFESEKYGNKLAVAFSPDGLHWTEGKSNPVGPVFEQSGITKFDGCYYVTGQGGRHYGLGRKLASVASYNFEDWTQAAVMGLRRGARREDDLQLWNRGEEVHLGASLWNRGNVLIGIYGQWHGSENSDRRWVGIDLGLVVSNDALHYREPIPDFRLLPAYEELETPLGREPALNQGQGFENIGDRTMFWYEFWGLGPVRLATWERDRLGYFSSMEGPAHFISRPFRADSPVEIFVNADGLSEDSVLELELLDEEFKPLPGYSSGSAATITENGIRSTVGWTNTAGVPMNEPIRIRGNFAGRRPEGIRLYAIYVEDLRS